MKFAIVFAAFVAVTLARPQTQDSKATVVKQEVGISADHSSYNFSHQSDNGIAASEKGTLRQSKSAESNEPAFGYEAQGQFTYTGPDGVQYRVTYTADENGFHPEGDHLPKV